MSDDNYIYLLYQKDFTERGDDHYFIYKDGEFMEVDGQHVVNTDDTIVTHDYWLIVNSLYHKYGRLPKKVVDVNLLARIVYGKKAGGGDIHPWDISNTIKPLYKNTFDFDEYVSMYYRRSKIDLSIYMLFSHKLAEYSENLFELAREREEFSRFCELELPVFNLLSLVVCKGIRVSNDILVNHKSSIKLDYYRGIKGFAEKHNVLYELPLEGDIRDKLEELGYDVENYATDFLIDFLPSIQGYTEDLRKLQKLNKSYRVFNNISSASTRIKPIAETHSTSTSRIYYKSPNIQNISKKYRDIYIPDNGNELSYIDYDQYEVGIMAALSGDEKMNDIYANMDAYINLSNTIFGSDIFRKKAKVLFLSYTYGMSMENILSSVAQLEGDVKKAKLYFSEFEVFEKWKSSLCETFQKDNRIPTIYANYLNRSLEGELTPKEKRSVVSHVVQGTGSYIFKSSLLKLGKEDTVQVLIPMHDAVLIQHPDTYDINKAVKIFEDTMSTALDNKIKGKASVEAFYVSS